MRSIIFTILLTASFGSSNSYAAKQSNTAQPTHWIVQYFEEVETAQPKHGENMLGTVKFVFGNNIWQPGRQFKDGSNWLALSCNANACSFEPASLKVSDESWQGHYDDKATSGQHLVFKQNAASEGKTIAWFQASATLRWLKPSVITSYYAGASQTKHPPSISTLEIMVDFPNGKAATLVPMLLKSELSKKLTHQFTPKYPMDSGSFHLQLRANGKRQLLLGELGNCNHVVSREYLLWAGDIDGDGKADYLVSFIDSDGPVHFYLSSLAKSNQLVGLAGVHLSAPYGGECDGSGWL